MAAYNKINQFVQDLAQKVHSLSADSFKIVLSNSATVATNTILANITQISSGAGYTTGGNASTVTSANQTSGTLKWITADVVFTATGSMGPFRYPTLYNDTPTSPTDPLIAWWDYGSSITLATGESFTTDLDQSGGVLTIA